MVYVGPVSLSRTCSRTPCSESAIATLTYVYSDSAVVLGPLATYAEPHTYDLCAEHAQRLTVPRGWEVVRLPGESVAPDNHDDLVALANVVREARREPAPPADVVAGTAPPSGEGDAGVRETRRRGHLRVLRDQVEG